MSVKFGGIVFDSKYANMIKNHYDDLIRYSKNYSDGYDFIYNEIIPIYKSVNRYGFKYETVLGEGEMYSIGNKYSYTKGNTGSHHHTGYASMTWDVYNYNDMPMDNVRAWTHSNKSSRSAYVGSDFSHTMSIYPDGVSNDKNKMWFQYSSDFVIYVGGNFYQDPYTMEYSGEPDMKFFLQTSTPQEKFYDDLQDEIVKFSSNNDSFSTSIRQDIAQHKNNILEAIADRSNYKFANNKDHYIKHTNRLIDELYKLQECKTLNKYYVIEHSTKWRNEFNFSPNKEFLPELEYADVGGHQSSDFTYFSNFFIKENSN